MAHEGILSSTLRSRGRLALLSLATSFLASISCSGDTATVTTRRGSTESPVTIASFNASDLGGGKQGLRDLDSLASILTSLDADLIALQRVLSKGGALQVGELAARLNRLSAKPSASYSYRVARGIKGRETSAFLWREPVKLSGEIALLDHDSDPDGDGVPTFQRVPQVATFRVSGTELSVVSNRLHNQVTDSVSEGREAELRELARWMKSRAEAGAAVILVGDFNRFLNGRAWDELMVADHRRWYRFPLLEAIAAVHEGFDPLRDNAPTDALSTTTKPERPIYDQFVISEALYSAVPEPPVLDRDVGVHAFDLQDEYRAATEDWQTARRRLSDHRPIWLRLAAPWQSALPNEAR